VTFVEIVCVLRSWVFKGFRGFQVSNFRNFQGRDVFRLSAGWKTEPPERFKTKKSGKVSEDNLNNLSRVIFSRRVRKQFQVQDFARGTVFQETVFARFFERRFVRFLEE
jgi:hypothetical protein